MNRRNFIRLAALSGVSVISAAAHASVHDPMAKFRSPSARGHNAAYDGPCYIFVNAAGGWDPVHLCDPKGTNNLEDPNRLTNYLESDIENAGNIRYAPVGGNQAFFQKYYDRLTIINGIDTQTNGHDSGSRFIFSGRLAEGYPSLAALVAANADPSQPMAYLSFGGYDLTQGIVARTRSGNVGALSQLAFPTRRDPSNEDSGFHSDTAGSLLRQAQAQREALQRNGPALPRTRRAMNTLFTARSGSNELRLLQEYLPEQLDNTNNPLRRQAQLALAAYRAGICISANLNVGGFDTHGNHDASHIPRLQTLLEGVDFIMDEAARQQISDKVVVVVGSDFGRTPRYNDQNGKDHWSITSMMVMGPGIPGNRVVGATDGGHNSLNVDPGNLRANSGGVRLTPAEVHIALRKYAGLTERELTSMFPISGEDLPLLG